MSFIINFLTANTQIIQSRSMCITASINAIEVMYSNEFFLVCILKESDSKLALLIFFVFLKCNQKTSHHD